MATAADIDLSEPHPPKDASIVAFEQVLPSLKQELVKLRHNHDKHEPEYFRAAKDLSDDDLAGFGSADIESVRVADTAYGLHLFVKVRIPDLDDGYIHARIFIKARDGTDGSSVEEREAKLHSIHTEEAIKDDGDRVYRAIFGKDDRLEWFET